MATIRDVLSTKGSADVIFISPQTTVVEAAQTMNERRIGAVVVVQGERVRGIFTERDVLRRVVATCRDPAGTPVEQVMTQEVVCGTLETTVEEARSVFKNRRIRHLPVVDAQQRIAGMISIGDLNAYEANVKETTIRFLHEYLYGST